MNLFEYERERKPRLRFFLCFVVLCGLLLLSGRADLALAGQQGSAEASEKLVPELENTLTGLLAASSGGALPPTEELLELARFMISTSTIPDHVQVAKRDQGEGVFMRQNLKLPLSKLLRYSFDPEIPTQLVYPMVLRRGFWLPESPLVSEGKKLWTLLDARENAPLRGTESEEISPDTFSGCYYSYRLHRLFVPLRLDDMPVLFSISRQAGPSTVGYKGAIAGDDKNWNYVYSRVVGSNLKLVGWAETFMYDSASVSLLYPNGEGSAMAFFKWVNAGWSNMNMVKSKHIRSGGERFLFSLRQVLESPRLPAPEEIVAQLRKLEALDEGELRKAFAPQAALLEQAGKNGGDLAGSDFKKLFEGEGYAAQLDREALLGELMKLYMKERLGLKEAPGP